MLGPEESVAAVDGKMVPSSFPGWSASRNGGRTDLARERDQAQKLNTKLPDDTGSPETNQRHQQRR